MFSSTRLGILGMWMHLGALFSQLLQAVQENNAHHREESGGGGTT